jgi:hypothetical protein
LEKAVEEVMKALKMNPPPEPHRPAYPNYQRPASSLTEEMRRDTPNNPRDGKMARFGIKKSQVRVRMVSAAHSAPLHPEVGIGVIWGGGRWELVWDRLPMTVAFMGFFASMIGGRISVRSGT